MKYIHDGHHFREEKKNYFRPCICTSVLSSLYFEDITFTNHPFVTDVKETAFLHNLVCAYHLLVRRVGRLREKLGSNKCFGFSVVFLLLSPMINKNIFKYVILSIFCRSYDLGHVKN